jgi:hypothetical protein
LQAGVIVAIVAAVIAGIQARDARQERIATETLRRDISSVAANVTRMAFVVADGLGRWGGVPDVHRRRLEEYRDAMRTVLPPDLAREIDQTIRDLDQQIRDRNRTK